MVSPWPLDAWPNVPTRFVLCTEDRFFPPEFSRRLVAERLGITPDETAAGPQLRARLGAQLGDLVEEVQHTFCE